MNGSREEEDPLRGLASLPVMDVPRTRADAILDAIVAKYGRSAPGPWARRIRFAWFRVLEPAFVGATAVSWLAWVAWQVAILKGWV